MGEQSANDNNKFYRRKGKDKNRSDVEKQRGRQNKYRKKCSIERKAGKEGKTGKEQKEDNHSFPTVDIPFPRQVTTTFTTSTAKYPVTIAHFKKGLLELVS